MSDNKFKDFMLKVKDVTLMVLKKIWAALKIAGIAVGKWFASRWVGFFLLIPVAIATFVFAFVYKAKFFNTDNECVTVFVLPFFTVASILLACFRPTARYAPIVMFALQLVTLGLFVWTGYMYLSSVFFSGIQGNVLVQAGFHFSYCALCPVIGMIICTVAMCFRQYKDEKQTFFGTPAYAMKKVKEAASE